MPYPIVGGLAGDGHGHSCFLRIFVVPFFFVPITVYYYYYNLYVSIFAARTRIYLQYLLIKRSRARVAHFLSQKCLLFCAVFQGEDSSVTTLRRPPLAMRNIFRQQQPYPIDATFFSLDKADETLWSELAAQFAFYASGVHPEAFIRSYRPSKCATRS